MREGDVVAAQHHIESNQKRTCADGDCARRLVDHRQTFVRIPLGVRADLFAQQLERAAPHVFEVNAIRPQCGAFVVIDRN